MVISHRHSGVSCGASGDDLTGVGSFSILGATPSRVSSSPSYDTAGGWLFKSARRVAPLLQKGKVSKSKINIMTVYESKGLEFSSVVVVKEGLSKSELYIAYTRALKELAVVGTNEKELK